MTEHDKQSMLKMGEVISQLPEAKKERFIGFAEGVVAMAEQLKPDPVPTQAN